MSTERIDPKEVLDAAQAEPEVRLVYDTYGRAVALDGLKATCACGLGVVYRLRTHRYEDVGDSIDRETLEETLGISWSYLKGYDRGFGYEDGWPRYGDREYEAGEEDGKLARELLAREGIPVSSVQEVEDDLYERAADRHAR